MIQPLLIVHSASLPLLIYRTSKQRDDHLWQRSIGWSSAEIFEGALQIPRRLLLRLGHCDSLLLFLLHAIQPTFLIPFLLLLGCPAIITNAIIANVTKQDTSASTSTTKLEKSDLFSSEVRWTCTDNFVEIRIHTTQPFNGIANVAGTRSLGCAVQGTGKLITEFRLNWESDVRHCGFNKNESSYEFGLEVHQYAGLIQEYDSTFHLKCTVSDDMPVAVVSSQETLLEDEALIAMQNNSQMQNKSVMNGKKQFSSASHIDSNYRLALSVLKTVPDMVDDISSLPLVEFGRSYMLVANLIPVNINSITYRKTPAFRIHSCTISPAEDLDASQKVEVIDSAGCATQPSLLSSFEYSSDGRNLAFSHIPSIFRFPDSKTLRFRCSFELCQENDLCDAHCNNIPVTSAKETPHSDHSREDLEEIAELLGSGLDESEDDKEHLVDISEKQNHNTVTNKSSNTANKSSIPQTVNKKAKISSVIVHVMERLGTTVTTPTTTTTTTETFSTISDSVDLTTTKPSSCITPADVLLLYKLCIGLCFLFVLGCCCNIVFCCMSKGFPWNRKNEMKCKKRMAVSTSFQHQYPFSSPASTCTTANGHRYGTLPSGKGEFWIQDTPTAREPNAGTPFYSSHYTDLPLASSVSKDHRRGSLSSYASVKQRGSVVPSNRMHESLHSHFRLSNAATTDGVTIRPYSQATSSISPSVSGGGLRSTATTVYDPLAYSAPAPSTTTFHGSITHGGSVEPPASSSLSTATTNSMGGSSLAEEDDSFSRHASSPVPANNRNSSSGSCKRSSASPPIELAAANCSSFSTTHRPAPPPPSASIQPYQSFKGASPTEYEMMPPGVNVGPSGEDRRQSYSIL
ncbi:CUTiclin-Like [Ditylenchus destructor]|nr:CUTiclin-Like [Ditylenchus destructor]